MHEFSLQIQNVLMWSKALLTKNSAASEAPKLFQADTALSFSCHNYRPPPKP